MSVAAIVKPKLIPLYNKAIPYRWLGSVYIVGDASGGTAEVFVQFGDAPILGGHWMWSLEAVCCKADPGAGQYGGLIVYTGEQFNENDPLIMAFYCGDFTSGDGSRWSINLNENILGYCRGPWKPTTKFSGSYLIGVKFKLDANVNLKNYRLDAMGFIYDDRFYPPGIPRELFYETGKREP